MNHVLQGPENTGDVKSFILNSWFVFPEVSSLVIIMSSTYKRRNLPHGEVKVNKAKPWDSEDIL